jgi:predicted DNA-binding transcriptional regulator AlpA
MPKKILTFPELADHGIRTSRRQIDRLEAAGKFPRRVQISPGRVGWLTDEIDGHVAAAIARRPPPPNSQITCGGRRLTPVNYQE